MKTPYGLDMTWHLYQKGSWTEIEYIKNTCQQLDEIDREYHKQALRSVVTHLKCSHSDWTHAIDYFKMLYRLSYGRNI